VLLQSRRQRVQKAGARKKEPTLSTLITSLIHFAVIMHVGDIG